MPEHGRLHHDVPGWVDDGAAFHIRVRAKRGTTIIDADGIKPRAILEATRHYHEHRRWFCRLMLVMPDHLHAVITFPPGGRMSTVIGEWKSYLAKASGVRWQSDYFDHRLRSRKEADECWHYIRQNPVRAGLVATLEAWPWVWSPSDITVPG